MTVHRLLQACAVGLLLWGYLIYLIWKGWQP